MQMNEVYFPQRERYLTLVFQGKCEKDGVRLGDQ